MITRRDTVIDGVYILYLHCAEIKFYPSDEERAPQLLRDSFRAGETRDNRPIDRARVDVNNLFGVSPMSRRVTMCACSSVPLLCVCIFAVTSRKVHFVYL